jgi:hypothetical protein
MRDRAVPVILLVVVGVVVAVSEGPLRAAAAVTFLTLLLPAWRSDLAGWFVASSVVVSFALGVVWYVAAFDTKAWAFAAWGLVVVGPILAEALTNAVEERGEPRSGWHRLVRATAIAISPTDGGIVGDGDC